MQIVILNQSSDVIEIADPSASDGGMVLRCPPGNTTFEVTTAVFDRLLPQLYALQDSKNPDGTSVAIFQNGDYGVSRDPRTVPPSPYQADIRRVSPGTLSVGSSTATINIIGYGLFGGQTVSTYTSPAGAGCIKWTYPFGPNVAGNGNYIQIINAGPSHALTVAVGGFYQGVVVTLATNSSGVPTSTAAQVVAAVAADGVAKYILVGTVITSGTAKVLPKTFLSGGTGPGISYAMAGGGGGLDTRSSDTHLVLDTFGGSGLSVGDSTSLDIYFGSTIVRSITIMVGA